MTTEPEYPIISTTDLVVGQEYRFGPQGVWWTASGRWSASDPQWVEAKPYCPLFLAGDRVRFRPIGTRPQEWDPWWSRLATVKHVGEEWLIVQVDGTERHASHEEAWLVGNTEHLQDDQ